MDMRVNMAGLKLSNPVMTASGTFGYGVEFKRYGQLEKLGGLVVKGLSLEPREGNPMPRIADAPAGMLNAIGLQNIGARNFVEKRLQLLPWSETAVVANLYACSAEEFGDLAAYLGQQEGIAALEVNISCPNVSSGGVLFGQDPSMAAAVTRAVKDHCGGKPVIVKLTPNVTDIATMAKSVVDAGADAVSLINTLSAMSVDARTRRPRLANVIGGLSGPAIKPVALRCVWQVAQAVDVPVIGMGGIASAEDVLEFILVGASAVQVGTSNFVRPDFAFRLVDELAALVDELGIKNWDEYRGSLAV
ncbi:MAG: dihydroorotate dehydrogenase [Proteobacteria bacterium]|nr:dihydroorotate dehydrogenase [Pseudomonadota bacterium]